ncbi:MAG: glycoside hydrolase [Candidatus Omnitrophica bacterium]|nr:glycoside hydrolase [Candidatus Omnitrophota bacterium]
MKANHVRGIKAWIDPIALGTAAGSVLSILILTGCQSTSTSLDSAAPKIVEVRRIWDRAPHNAFTDLTRCRGAWYCVFREGSGHVPGTDGVIRVLRSKDGESWESCARISETGIDLRDPKICVMPDGRLMVLMGGSIYSGANGAQGRTFVDARTRVAFSPDGQSWSEPQPVSVEGQWLWRVTWHKGAGYGFGYSIRVPANQVQITLWRTTDGINYQKIAEPKLPSTCWPDESTVRFLRNGTMVALVRGEQPGQHAFVGTSVKPYNQWHWTDTGHPAQGPNFIVPRDGRMLYAGRDFPDGPKTVLGLLTTTNSTPLLVLPSGGDTSYPGLVRYRGLLWMSYYSSHEGKTAIYLARIRI